MPPGANRAAFFLVVDQVRICEAEKYISLIFIIFIAILLKSLSVSFEAGVAR
jgi:hypothetical protein